MASVFFIAPADLGETVLATGALAHVLKEGDRLTILASADAMPLFRAAPGLANAYQWDAGEGFGSWVQLVWWRVRQPFDLAIDLLGSPATFAIPARRRLVRKQPKLLRHFSEDLSELVGAERTLSPVIWLDQCARDAAAAIAPDAAPLLLLAPGGNAESKRWPHERFAAVARRLATGRLANASIVVLSAAERDAEIAARIVSSLDADGVPAANLGASADLLAAAALTERATLTIGNDNALTHIAAAMGAPTLTLFGPTDERVRSPRGPRARTLRGKSFEEAALDARAAMDDIGIDAVEAAALDLLHAGGLR
jgi:ADP-heptose:LPS heptosyltransferase